MKKLLTLVLFLLSASRLFSQIYTNGFEGGTVSGTTYTGGVTTIATGLTTTGWTLTTTGSATTFTTFGGNAPTSATALSLSTAGPTTATFTCNLTVSAGYAMNMNASGIKWDYRETSTAYPSYSLAVNGTTVASGSLSTAGSFATLTAANAALSGLTGNVTVSITLSGGSHGSSGTSRVDNFNILGSVNVSTCSGTPASGTATAATPIICTSGSSVISLTGGASGSGISYNWQSSPDNTTWTPIGGATNTSYTTPTLTSTTPTMYYRCATLCTPSSTTSYSNGAQVKVTAITSNPTSVTIAATTGATMTVGATNAASYQWSRSTTGGAAGTFTNITSATLDPTGTYAGYNTSGTLTLSSVPFTWNQYSYKCTVTNSTCNITSGADTLTVTTTSCTGTPSAGTASAGTANFCTSGATVISLSGYTAAAGITYQWASSPDSVTWTPIASATNLTYTTPTLTTTTFYQCTTTCASGGSAISTGAKVTITSISAGPSSASIAAGTGTTFSITATGVASYQWQRGISGVYTNITSATLDATGTYSGYNSNTLTLATVPTSWNNYTYRCLVTNTCGSITSTVATLNVQCSGTPSAGNTQASSASVCAPATDNLSLQFATTGSGVSYVWYSAPDVSGAPGTFTAVSGATNATYVPTVAATTWYYCTVACSYSGLSGNSTQLQVVGNPSPPASVISGAGAILTGSTIMVSDTTHTGYTAAWSSSSTSVATVDATTGVVTGVATGSATISYTLTNSYSCTSVATAGVTVSYPYCTPSISATGDAVGLSTSGALSNISSFTSSIAFNNQFASQGVIATPGSTVNYTITNPSSYNTSYTVSIWVDWNKSGTFGDSTSEQVLSSHAITYSGGTYSGSFVVPTTARAGVTAMRIYIGEGTASSPCGSTTYGASADFYFKVPSLSTTLSSIPFGNVNVGSSSTLQYTLAGVSLYPIIGNVTITAPTSQYTLSTDNVTFGSSVTKAYGSTAASYLPATPIYVKYTPTSLTSTGNVTNAGGGAVTQNVAVSGNGGGFFLSPTYTNFFSISSSSSTTLPVTFYGQNLTGGPGNVTVSSTDSHFQVSLTSGSGYGSSVTVPYGAGGTLTTEPTTIYVQFTPGAVGSFAGNLNFSGGGFSALDTVVGNGAVFCTSPTGAPTGLSFTSTNANGTTPNFTPYTAVPDSYLVVSSSPAVLSGTPSDGTRYASGISVGTNGTSRGIIPSSGTSINGLAGNTSYYITLFPQNSTLCYGGPLYYTSTPLSGNVITCPSAPASSSTSSVTSSSFTVNWASSTGGAAVAVSYSLQVATDTAFSSPIAGSPFTTSALTYTISSGVNMNTTYYYRVTAIGACNSQPSTRGSVTTLCNNPTVTVSPTNSSICYGSLATVTGSGAGTGGTYSWSPATGVTTTGAVSSVSPSATTVFTVTGTNVYGCSSSVLDSVFVNTATAGISLSPTSATLCSGGSQLISALGTPTVLSENFNTSLATDAWVASLGTGAAAVVWTQFPSPAYVGSTAVTGTDSKMMVAQGNLGTSGTGTTVYLTSPSFSLAGLSAATINWMQYFVADGAYDLAHSIDISTNGGASWTAITTVAADAAGSALVAHSFSIPGTYLTSSNTNCKIRFTYQINGYTYGWAVDNVTITGTAAPVWSPVAGLYTNSAATTAYTTGTQSASVYGASFTTATNTTNIYSASMGACVIGTSDTIKIKPAVDTVTGGTACASVGTTLGLNTSQLSTSYQAFKDGVAYGSPLSGTGSALSFGTVNTPGTYTIVATSAGGCTTTMARNVVINANPAVYNVTGGVACSASGVPVGLSGSATGINYQLVLNGTNVGSPLAGTGSALTFGTLTAVGAYTIVASSTASCTTNMNGSDTVYTSPNAYAMTGGNGCSADGVTIGLANSNAYVSYQLYLDGVATGSPVIGPIGPITFGTEYGVGTYTVIATAPTTGCTRNMTGATVITVSPSIFNVTGGTSCYLNGGINVALDGSQTGVSYQLYNGTTAIGSPVNGTGGVLSFGLQTAVGNYSVVATSTASCNVNMAGTAIINPNPTAYSVTGGNGCSSSGVTVGIASTEASAIYQMTFNGSPSGSPFTGTGSAHPFGTQTSPGYYAVVASNSYGCSTNMTGIDTVHTSPGAFTVTGGGNYCGTTGLHVGINGSESIATYQLFRDGTLVLSPFTGTSSAIDFGIFSTAGSYTVVASGDGTCTTNMTGSATISNYTVGITPGASPSICTDATSVFLSYTGATGSPTTYSLNWDSDAGLAGFMNVTAGLPASAYEVAIPSGITTGTYNGTISVTNGICTSTDYPIHVTVVAYPIANIASATPPCAGYSSNIVFNGTIGTSMTYKVDTSSPVVVSLAGGSYSLATGVITSAHNYELINVFNGTCTTVLDTTVTLAPVPMRWNGTGTVSGHETDWNTSANWTCGFVPTVSDDVAIPSGTTYLPIITTGTYDVRALNIATGASINLHSGASLNVKGDLTNNGSVTNSGNLVLNGGSSQNINGIGIINNLTLNNANGATITPGSRATINSTLNLTSGYLVTNDSLVLNSIDSANSSRVTPISTGAGITGQVTTKKIIPGGNRAYRFWGHPFANSISLAPIQQCIDITGAGGAANGFTITASNAPSAFWYNTNYANSTLGSDPGWRPFTNTFGTPDSNMVHQYQGIRLYMRGAKGEGLGYITSYVPSAVTISMKGSLNQGTQIVHLTKGGSTGQDYNMVSNPYPSPIDLGAVTYNAKQTGNLAGNYFYVWLARFGPTGQFQAILINSTTPYYIDAFTSYQVRAAHNNDTMVFTESNKSGSISSATLLKETADHITLTVYDDTYNPWDRLTIRPNAEANEEEDEELDARKLFSPDFNFYSRSTDGKALTIDERPFVNDHTVPLGIASNYKQDLIIKVDGLSLPADKTLYLHDKLLGQYVSLQEGTEYKFSIGDDAKTQGDKRFELSIAPTINSTSLVVNIYPDPATDKITISLRSNGTNSPATIKLVNLTGLVVYAIQVDNSIDNKVNVPLGNQPAGIYLVEVTLGNQKIVKKIVKE